MGTSYALFCQASAQLFIFLFSETHVIFKRFVLCFREFPLLLDLQQNGNIGCHGDARGPRNDL